ncbi:MAG: DNA translocase FtsK 4TM domain-containing protein [Chromatiaceae bacterium]|nr:DNA translocase FtsK 4TM domain-containing protein [Chromatiaceae bacterium]
MEQATRLGHARLGDYLERAWREGALWVVVIISLYLVLALATYSPDDPGWSFAGEQAMVANTGGRFGAWFADLSLFLFGVFAYLIPIGLAASAFLIFREREPEPETKLYWLVLRWIGLLLTLAAGAGLASLQFAGPFGDLPNGIGGGLGQMVSELAAAAIGLGGGSLLLLGLLLIGLSLFTGLSPLLIVDGIGDLTLMVLRFPVPLYRRISATLAERRQRQDWDSEWEDEDDSEQDWLDEIEDDDADALEKSVEPWRSSASRFDEIDLPETTAPQQTPKQTPRNAIRSLNDETHGHSTELAETGLSMGVPPLHSAEPNLQIRIGTGFDSSSTLARAATQGRPSEPLSAPASTSVAETAKHEDAESLGSGWQEPASERTVETQTPATEALSPTLAERSMPAAAASPTLSPTPAITPLAPPVVEPAWADAATSAHTPAARPAVPQPAPSGTMAIRGDFSQRPPLDLLDPPRRSGNAATPEQIEAMSHELEARLAEFGVVAEVVEVHPGPVVALFELELAPGVKVSKITGLSKDIARALSKISVRVVEVIPGKSVIGIEVPNDQREMVTLSEIIGSRAYHEAKSPLTISMGTNISGEPVVADLGRMPHALIAGTTGSGKSVAINAMILSLVYKAGPDDVRLIMVDPKMLELSVYEGIPHLLTPVVTDMKEAANALRWCVGEMERRYKLMASLGVRNIAGYNRKVLDAIAAGEPISDPTYAPLVNAAIAQGFEPPEVPTLEKLPNIVVIIDELADMMMVVGKKVEELIARLAQKARASGIHLLLATQRPSVDVLTGLIKANIPTRMAFKVSARVDSRTVLDQMGAEHLLGHGDMLYLPPGGSISQRVHGAFVDDHEVHKVVDFLKQQGTPEYIENILQEPSDHLPGIDPEPKGGGDVEDQDPLFDEAVQIVVESRRASISGVQRRLKIGYNRAARMIEEMERIGVVGPAETNGNREVLAPPPQD